MFNHYFVNKNAQSTGEHEVHTETCAFLPDINNREYLGYFDSPLKAVEKACQLFNNVDGCFYCCKSAHTK